MILVGIGSNLPGPIGSSTGMVEAAFAALDEAPLRLLAQSVLWRTRPVPDHGDPWFVNAVASIETGLDPVALLTHLLEIEQRFGRERGEANAPRTLDLDLLDYHGRISQPGEIPHLPHPRLAGRAFVLKPLADIAPDWRHPVDGRSLPAMIAALPSDQTAEPIDAA